MELDIRFCARSDGVRLAYGTVGSGPPLMRPPGWISHLEQDWKDPPLRAFYESLATHHRLIAYDKHGVGLSDRDRTEFSLEAEVRDLETVVDHLALDRLALLGISQAGAVAAAYAVKHPERVSHLILYGAYARGGTIAAGEFRSSLMSLIRAHWGVGSKALADLFLPGADATAADNFAKFQRASASAEMAARLLNLVYEIDVTDRVPDIRAPTLVIHREKDRAMPFRLGRELAVLIPQARFVPLEGRIHFPWLGDTDSVLRAIADFLGDPVAAPGSAAPLTVLFTDMESSTAFTQRLGDAKAQELVRAHNTIVRQALKAHGGTEIKHTGDGIMASFASASGALECAIAIQRSVEERRSDDGLRVHIGLNAGEPVAEDDDLFGTAVQLARRICDQAGSGEILASDVIRQLVAGKGFLFADRGEVALRGFEDPVRLYELRWND